MPQTTCQSGYMLLRNASALLEAYRKSEFATGNAAVLEEHRRTLESVDPARYRGISRQPLDALQAQQLSLIAPPNATARMRMRERVRDEENEELLETYEDAHDVWLLLDDREAYEIVRIERGDFTGDGDTLGYDAGWWGGDHFSVICDVAVMPRWHPPDPNDFAAVADALRSLNSNILFPSAAAAEAFLTFYRSREWAETESEGAQFEIIRVASPVE